MANAVVFPGQGAQKVGMGADFVERFSVARELFEQAAEVLGYDLGQICLEGPDETLTLTKHCQPAIFLVSAAIIRVLEDEGKLDRESIAFTAGLSLGEYTALWFAGVLGFEDGLRLVARRGEAMQAASDAPPSGMISLLGADLEVAEAIATEAAEGEVLSVANLLSPGQIVLSGTKTALARVPEMAKARGIRRAIPLNVAGAFHSALMAPAAETLVAALAETTINAPRIPVVSNVTGRPMSEPAEIRENLGAQVVKPVQWHQSMQHMIDAGVTEFIEPGPGRVLAGLLRKIDRDKSARNIEAVAEL